MKNIFISILFFMFLFNIIPIFVGVVFWNMEYYRMWISHPGYVMAVFVIGGSLSIAALAELQSDEEEYWKNSAEPRIDPKKSETKTLAIINKS